MTRPQLNTEIDTLFADVGAEDISPADVRTSLKNIVASALVLSSDGTPLYPAAIGSTLQAHSAALDTFAANGSAYYLSRGNHSGTQTASTISDFSTSALAAVTWSTLTGKPATFAPSSHTHTASEVTDFASAARAQVESMLAAGSNITLTPSGTGATRQITIASTASGGSSYTFSAPLVNTGGTVSLSAATTGAAGSMSAADKTKLDGIASGATANASDAQLRDRSTHTGTQAISTVTGLQTALDGKLGSSAQAADVNPAGSAIATALSGKAASSHGHTASDVSDFASAARAQVESMLVAGTNVTLTPSGTGATRQITVAASGTGGGWASGFLFGTGQTENINNTPAGEVTILTGTIPANTLANSGSSCLAVIFGSMLNNTGSGTAVTLRVKYGGVTVYQANTASIGTSSSTRQWRIEMRFFNDGATNAQVLEFFGFPIGPAATNSGTGNGALSGTDASAAKPVNGTCAVDSTVDQTFAVTIQHSVQSAQFTWTTRRGGVWRQ